MPAGDDGPVAAAELAVFVREHFMKDAQLAKQHPAANSKAYWVRRQGEELRRGSFQKVLDDSQLRLEMNNAKTTVFSPVGDLADAANWNCKVQPDGCTVLGTPIGSPEFIRQRLEKNNCGDRRWFVNKAKKL